MKKKGKKPSPVTSKPFLRFESPVEEEVDLHGLAIDEAMVQAELAIARWKKHPGACIRFIHGKSSGNQNSIKGALRRNLETAWKHAVRSFRPELANPGATLVSLL